MEHYIARLQDSYRKALHDLHKDLCQVGAWLGDTETTIDWPADYVDNQQITLKAQSSEAYSIVMMMLKVRE